MKSSSSPKLNRNQKSSSSSSIDTPTKISFKVVLLGEGAVGKSSLAKRFMELSFTENHEATIQAAFFTKNLYYNKQRIELNVWDTAGQERFHALSPIYYRNAHGALLVYDLTDSNSFHRLLKWVVELQTMVDQNIPLLIVGNKKDLPDHAISTEDREKYLKEHFPNATLSTIDTSAKLNENVQEAFLKLTEMMLQNQKSSSLSSQSGSKNQSKHSVLIAEPSLSSNTKKSCCQK